MSPEPEDAGPSDASPRAVEVTAPDAGPGPDGSGPSDEIRIGISACLLGQEVRWDGGHKRDRFLTDTLAAFVRFVPVCPEAEIGLGIPREPIRLEMREGAVHLVGTRTGVDVTERMRTYSARKVDALAKLDLSGYVLKKDSPSCGMERVRIYGRGGVPSKGGRGLFAESLMARLPHLPIEEEGRLNDPRLRECFLERVFAYRRVRSLFAGRWGRGDLVRFHSTEKLLLMAHDPVAYRALGRLVGTVKGRPRAAILEEYTATFLAGLARMATPRKHANVLQHVLGHFKEILDAEDRQEILRLIEDFRSGLVPLVVPVTLIRHHVRRNGIEYLQGQTYLGPHPKELMLRNHV